MDVRMIGLGRLVGHRLNSNVMSKERFGKLKLAIGESGRYPPVVVRSLGNAGDQESGSAGGEEGGDPGQGFAASNLREAMTGLGMVRGDPDLRSQSVAPVRLEGEVDIGEMFEILDGHHRVKVLRELGYAEAMCVVWAVDDGEALALLATLNRLEGSDDPVKRAALVAELGERYGKSAGELGRVLPEGRKGVERLLRLREPVVARSASAVTAGLPESVHFFLPREEKAELERVLREIGGRREEALMAMVRGLIS